MRWPEPKKGIPEGHYCFTLIEEPELFKNESGKFRISMSLVATPGDIKHKESFFPWEPRYEDLCRVLNVEHGRDIRMEGASFEGDIFYEPSQKDPTKAYARIKNITAPGEFSAGKSDPDGDIPF
jgi:hypothetical protein